MLGAKFREISYSEISYPPYPAQFRRLISSRIDPLFFYQSGGSVNISHHLEDMERFVPDATFVNFRIPPWILV